MTVLTPYVLCVDDDADDLLLITAAIQKLEPSCRTVTVRDGVEALEWLRNARQTAQFSELILMDINMPRLNGKETLRRLKEDPELRAIPVVIFSTSTLPADRIYCAHYNTPMATKPSSFMELERVLQKVINQVFHH